MFRMVRRFVITTMVFMAGFGVASLSDSLDRHKPRVFIAKPVTIEPTLPFGGFPTQYDSRQRQVGDA